MTTDGGGSARTPLEALLLALRHSRGSHLTGSGVLRQVLAGSVRDMIQGGNFELTPVWDLLAAQPRFEAAEVMPAFAKVKSWEAKLGKKILLPPLMQHLTESELSEMAASIHVPATELAHVLRGGKVQTENVEQIPESEPPRPRARRLAGGGAEIAEPAAGTTKKKDRQPRIRLSPKKRRAAVIGAAAIALLSFAFAGVTLVRGCQGRSWDAVALDFAGDIPLASAERSGPEVAATLRDPAWVKLPADRRREQMRAALRALPAGTEVFFVRDLTGKPVATARWYGKRPRQIAVTLR